MTDPDGPMPRGDRIPGLSGRVRLAGVVAFALVVGAPALAAQAADRCGVELRGGVRAAPSQAVETGSPVNDMTTGVALAVGVSCPLSDRFRVGVDVEANTGPHLSVFHFLLIGERRISAASNGSWTFDIRGGAGWARTADGQADHFLLAAGGGRAIQAGTSGPAVAVGGRIQAPLSGRFRLLIDAGWRGSLVEETDFDLGETKRRKTIHVFPVTIGLRFRL